MTLNIDTSKKVIILWKSTAESSIPVPCEMQEKIDEYCNNKYRYIIMNSGSGDLFDSTLALLLKNRMNNAIRETQTEILQCGKEDITFD
ncbi:MAG: hypothetical protein IJZ47_10045 [Oscillospiraceae bacterium]|nr:hypothetical protein [Oscillospiraceae bacterium]